jgi:predicted DNA-binding protein (UPF0251 family)
VIVDGVEYSSIKQASLITGVPKSTIWNRLNSSSKNIMRLTIKIKTHEPRIIQGTG